VLTSIVLGLGVTRAVGGLGQLMQGRKRKRAYWVHTLWAVNLLLVNVIVWWFAYRWRTYERWTFFLFLWLLLSPIVLYLIASLLFPDADVGQPVTEWRAYYYENHRDIRSEERRVGKECGSCSVGVCGKKRGYIITC